jgi:hypothetical protein
VSWWYLKPANCFLCHIPKNGGSSIREGIFTRGRTERVDRSWDNPEGAAVLTWENGDPVSKLDASRSFAMVRNPYERFLSGLYYVRKRLLPAMTPEDALELVQDDSVDPAGTTKAAWARHHLLPQTHPFYGLSQCRYLYAFEFYEESIRDAGERFGFKLPERLPHYREGHWKPSLQWAVEPGFLTLFSEDQKLWEKVIDHHLDNRLPFEQ